MIGVTDLTIDLNPRVARIGPVPQRSPRVGRKEVRKTERRFWLRTDSARWDGPPRQLSKKPIFVLTTKAKESGPNDREGRQPTRTSQNTEVEMKQSKGD